MGIAARLALGCLLSSTAVDGLLANRAQQKPPSWPLMVQQTYGLRASARAVLKADAAAAVELGLEWLQQHQDKDGRWDCDGFMKHDAEEPCDGKGKQNHDIGVTGLALLAFLSEGKGHDRGPHQNTIGDALAWLRKQQARDGLFGNKRYGDFFYDHAIAAYAVCEAYGLSGDAEIRDMAQKALDYIESHRNPTAVWRYQPRSNDNDLSISAWCVAATRAGSHFGLRVEPAAWDMAAAYLDAISDPTGKHGYTRRGEGSARRPGDHGRKFPVRETESLTACGLFTRFLLGQNPDDVSVMSAGADLLLAKLPVWSEERGSIDLYYWYYGSLACRQLGGEAASRWRTSLRKALLPTQRADGAAAGSWDPVSSWGDEGGRVYSTAMSVLSLQAEYRYARFAELVPLSNDELFRVAKAAWRKGSYGAFAKALEVASAKEPTEDQRAQIEQARTALEEASARARGKVATIETAKDYRNAAKLEKVAKDFKGLSAAVMAARVLGEWSKDRVVKREIKAFDELAKLRKYADKPRIANKKVLVRLAKFLRKYDGTQASTEGKAWQVRLQRKR